MKDLAKPVILLSGRPSLAIFSSAIRVLRCWPYFISRRWSAGKLKILDPLFDVPPVTQKCLCFSGLGFITGSGMAAATGSWNWGLRVTPILSMVSVLLIAFVMRDPPRGLSEGSRLVSTSWQKDMVYLVKKYCLFAFHQTNPLPKSSKKWFIF